MTSTHSAANLRGISLAIVARWHGDPSKTSHPVSFFPIKNSLSIASPAARRHGGPAQKLQAAASCCNSREWSGSSSRTTEPLQPACQAERAAGSRLSRATVTTVSTLHSVTRSWGYFDPPAALCWWHLRKRYEYAECHPNSRALEPGSDLNQAQAREVQFSPRVW